MTNNSEIKKAMKINKRQEIATNQTKHNINNKTTNIKKHKKKQETTKYTKEKKNTKIKSNKIQYKN